MWLNQTSYPSLVDDIIGYAAARFAAPATACPRTVAALRLTSRKVRDVADLALLYHVEMAITRGRGDDDGNVSLTLPRDVRFTAFVGDAPPPRVRRALPFRPSRVRILDLDPDLDCRDHIPAVFDGLSLATVRRFADHRYSHYVLVRRLPVLCADTLVDFVRPLDGDRVDFPPGVRRYVLHLAWTPAVGCSAQFAHLFFKKQQQQLHEVVIVLRPRVTAFPEHNYRHFPRFIAHALLLGFDVVRRGGSLTVVGGELVHPLQLGGREADPRWRLAAFERVLWGVWKHAGFDDDGKERVRLVRLGDWWKELGERKNIEGVWPAADAEAQ